MNRPLHHVAGFESRFEAGMSNLSVEQTSHIPPPDDHPNTHFKPSLILDEGYWT